MSEHTRTTGVSMHFLSTAYGLKKNIVIPPPRIRLFIKMSLHLAFNHAQLILYIPSITVYYNISIYKYI